jgi:tetratricopeptide (TPR) repeat protein
MVNLRALLVLLACALALGVGVHLVHGYQIKRNAGALLGQAEQAEQEAQPARAADYLGQYLGLEPGDNDALARYGVLLDKLARNPRQRLRPFYLLEQVLRRDGSRADVRRRLARMGTELEQFSAARAHLEVLLKEAPGDAELLQLMGRCEAGERRFNKAGEWYARAVKRAPGRVELCQEYAELLRRRLEAPEQADAVIGAMVRAAARSLPARLAAARYFLRRGLADRAEKQVKFALGDLKAQSAEALLLASEVASALGRKGQAREPLERGVKLHPGDLRLRLALAQSEFQEGRRARALELLRPCLNDLPADADELARLGRLLVDLGETARAEKVCQRLQTAGSAWEAGLLRGGLLVRKGAWGQARLLLEKVRSEPLPTAEVVRGLNLLLAECYGRLGNPDQQLSACRRALESDPSWPPARRLLASALLALGKTDEAINEYRRLDTDAEGRRELIRLLLRRNLRLPAAERSWGEVERALQGFAAGRQPTAEVQLLRAEVLAARGEAAQARKLAEAERDRAPREVGPWLLLASLEQRQGRSVLPLLEQAERQAGRRVEWELARARHWARAGKPEARQQLRRLEGRLGGFAAAEQDRLLLGLAGANAVAGDLPAAGRLWRQVARRQPGNLNVRFLLFERALEAGWHDEARGLVGEIKRLEGEGGPIAAYAEAALRLEKARPGDTEGLAEVSRLLAQVASARPSWSRPALLEARLHDLEGRKDKALERYQTALKRGETGLGVVRRALQLLSEQGRYAEANALLRTLPEQDLSAPGLGRLAAELSLLDPAGAENRKRALELAGKAVPADSKDYRDHLWLGQVYATAGQPRQAERAFRRARDLAPTAPETWVVLLAFLARVDAKGAEVELQAAKARLPKDRLSAVLGPAYEALGRPEQAEEHYRADAAARPDDPVALSNAAGFYARVGQRDKAEPYLRQITEGRVKAPAAQVASARRSLAVLLAVGGSYQQFQEAQALLRQNAGEGAETPEDRQARALVLATRPASRREAIRLFEGLSSRSAAAPAEHRFRLAQLYEADGNWPRARAHLLALLGEHGKNPVYLAHYVRALLRHKQVEEAREWLDRLAGLRPAEFETVELRARVFHATGQTDAAVEALRAYTRQKDARLDLTAALFDQLGRAADAEKTYRAHAATAKDPLGSLLLAQHLGRRGRVEEALRLCEKAWGKGPPESVGVASLGAVRTAKASAGQRRRVQRWLEDAVRKAPQSPLLPVLLADLHDVSGRHDHAITLYRRILEQAPRNAVALNNLALVLALQGKHAEALKLIQTALDEAGPEPALLDTRAVIYNVGGRADLAVKDLQQAVAQAPSGSRYFHLAQAHMLLKDRRAAHAAYRRATDLGLQEDSLHPLEWAAHRQLAEQLK